MPVMPLFCLGAGYGLSLLLQYFRMGQWRRLAAGLIVIVIGFGLARLQVVEPFDFSHSYTDEGIAYEMKGDEQEALTAYNEALRIAPDYLRALEHLGKLQMKRKDYPEARTTYKKILTIKQDSVDAKYQLMWLDKMGL
jgi:tetratricopeptide (TPR) repeat protein